mmetsp:Transcript_14505/g.34357  ORF Transcript_14505/g.34357 Transcript_14505/m.34357 type:complete len:166 (+) Transcript_14505:28-525(+)
MQTRATLTGVLSALLCAAIAPSVIAELDPSWQDTELTTKMWRLITSNENSELQKLLEEDESNALVRSADGRGPMFWAHEANNEEAITMLKAAGAKEEWEDADGKTCSTFEHGKLTEYMRKLNEARAAEYEEQRRRMEEAAVDIEDDDDDDEDDDDDDDDEDEDDE